MMARLATTGDTNMISGLMDLLNTCYECGDFALMEVVAKTVQQSIPGEIVSLHFLGLAYLKTGRPGSALSLFKRLRKKIPFAKGVGSRAGDYQPLPDTHTAEAGCYLEATSLNPGLARTLEAAAAEIESFARSNGQLIEQGNQG
jgi:hypothetical protein